MEGAMRKAHYTVTGKDVQEHAESLIHKHPKEIYRSQAKDGTNNFHAYASAYVVCKGQRFTVALTPVERGEKMKDVVQRLLTQARRASIRPGLLLLDRGFYCVEVIRYLQAA